MLLRKLIYLSCLWLLFTIEGFSGVKDIFDCFRDLYEQPWAVYELPVFGLPLSANQYELPFFNPARRRSASPRSQRY